MNLYLMRHAHAIDQEQWSGQDEARPLIEKGRQAAQAAAQGMALLSPPITYVVTSPLTRALQTAQLVAAGVGASITESMALSPQFDITKLADVLALTGWANDVLLVGHQPSLGVVLSALTGRSLSETDLTKAGVALVTLPVEAAQERRLVKVAEWQWMRGWREWENTANAQGVQNAENAQNAQSAQNAGGE